MRFAQPMLSSAGRRPGEEAVRGTAPSQARPLSPRERQKQCLSGLPQATSGAMRYSTVHGLSLPPLRSMTLAGPAAGCPRGCEFARFEAGT